MVSAEPCLPVNTLRAPKAHIVWQDTDLEVAQGLVEATCRKVGLRDEQHQIGMLEDHSLDGLHERTPDARTGLADRDQAQIAAAVEGATLDDPGKSLKLAVALRRPDL